MCVSLVCASMSFSTHTLACIVIISCMCYLAFVFHWFVLLCHLAHIFIAFLWLLLYVCTHTLSLHLYDCTCVFFFIDCVLTCFFTLMHFHNCISFVSHMLGEFFHDDYTFPCMLNWLHLFYFWMPCHVLGIRCIGLSKGHSAP